MKIPTVSSCCFCINLESFGIFLGTLGILCCFSQITSGSGDGIVVCCEYLLLPIQTKTSHFCICLKSFKFLLRNFLFNMKNINKISGIILAICGFWTYGIGKVSSF